MQSFSHRPNSPLVMATRIHILTARRGCPALTSFRPARNTLGQKGQNSWALASHTVWGWHLRHFSDGVPPDVPKTVRAPSECNAARRLGFIDAWPMADSRWSLLSFVAP